MANNALLDNGAVGVKLATALGAPNVNALGTVTSGSTINVPDPTVANVTTITLSAATIPFALPTPALGKKLRLFLTQDGTGSRLATFTTASGAIQWLGAAAPTLTITAGHSDLITFECLDGVNWFGYAQLNYH